MSAQTSNKWLITVTVMLVAIIEVLDTTIVNVALPAMMGSLGANANQITWVLTSYIVAAAVCMPLTGYFVARLGTRMVLNLNIIGFLLASMLCGLSSSLTSIVFFRTLQGLFGAGLVPMSQYILRDTFEPHEQGLAMAIWGVGIMVAPVLGPTLGGYITEHLSWRWIFYINLPVCLIALFMALRVINDTPRGDSKTDWVGAALMIGGIACLQIFLDRGNEEGWFQSLVIILLFISSAYLLSVFIVRGLGKSDNIISLSLFRDRNFASSSFLMAVFGIGIFGVMAIQPIQLEQLMGYPAETTGLLLAPRALSSAITMFLIGPMLNRTDPRWFVACGLICSAIGSYQLALLSPLTDMRVAIFWPTIWQGVGMGLFFVPLATLSMISLPRENIAEASGIFSFCRNLGSSSGISLISTLVAHYTATNWNELGATLSVFDANVQHWLHSQGFAPGSEMGAKMLSLQLQSQASFIAFNDAYKFVAILFIVMLPLIFTIRPPAKDADLSDMGGVH